MIILTADDYKPRLASSDCYPSVEAAQQHIRRAGDGDGFAHIDDWGVLTTYDSDGHAIQHAVVEWPAAVAYFEQLSNWDAFSRTGHLDELCARNLTDDARQRIRQARQEKHEAGETPWPRVPFECRSQSPTGASNGTETDEAGVDVDSATSTAGISAQSPTARPAASPTAGSESSGTVSAPGPPPSSRQLKPSVPAEALRPIKQYCLNTPCSSDNDCSSQGCGTCVMRDKFLFLSCSG